MVPVTAAQLVEALRRGSLIDPARLADVHNSVGETAPARAMADVLQRRGWLTSFQVEQLLQGRGDELALGPFIVLDRLGKGGMGEVYRASHTLLGRIVALKAIRPENLKYAGVAERFQREAKAAARLQHPNVVTIHDVQDSNGTFYIAMELIDGIDLSRLVKQNGSLPVAQACDYARQAALGLQHAFERDLVHRDIKPSNLMVTRIEGAGDRFGLVKILDFGLARVADESGGSDTLTPTDQWIGTPDYIAPEQARNSKTVDIRADIYSLGCTLYYLLTGRAPFTGGNRVEKLVARLEHEPAPASHHRPQVPARLDAVLARMMAREPAARFATPLAAARALQPFCRGDAAPASDSGSDQPTVSAGHGSRGHTLGNHEHGAASSPVPSISPWTPTMMLPAETRRRRRGVFVGLGAVVILAAFIPLFWPRGAPSENGGGGADKELVNSIGRSWCTSRRDGL
jgi:eukaryotic-like serine/threonine-protein kinase